MKKKKFSVTRADENVTSRYIKLYTLFISFAFLVASGIGTLLTHETDFFDNIIRILTSPCQLVTDYFALGGLGSTFFNAALCGLSCNVIISISRIKANCTTFAGYFLVVAHCFYGLNFLNMWLPMLGVLLFCRVLKKSFRANLNISFFATALGPFISDILFRYTLDEKFSMNEVNTTIVGIIIAILFCIATGFVVPSLLPGTTAMHRGFNMYKAGLAIGILGIFVYSFMYRTLGIDTPQKLTIDNPEYYALEYGYRGFVNVFFIIIFAITLLFGFLMNGKSFKGYKKLWRSAGYGTDFSEKFGMPLCFINIGIYGLLILVYLNIVFVLPEVLTFLPKGVGFTGATTGVVFAALTFSTDGQQPRTIAPIVLGYIILQTVVCIICAIMGADIPWSLSCQEYINGLAFATGLCAFSGIYGKRYGTIAGFMSAIICGATSAMHGGFVLYNGGLTAGLTALVLLPILDYYKVKPRNEPDL